MFFMNGEARTVPAPARAAMRRLADARRIPAPAKAPAAFWDVAHEWYLDGTLHLEGEEP